MNREIQVLQPSHQDLVPYVQGGINHFGNNGTQIAHVETVNIHNFGINQLPDASLKFDNDYYNLFVIEDETFESLQFTVPGEVALTKAAGMAKDIEAEFAGLTHEAITRIKTFPSIFASTNRGWATTDNDHKAIYGVVTDVRPQGNSIKISFRPICVISQQQLNENAAALGITSASTSNELKRTHWAIKPIHLIEELHRLGINVPTTPTGAA